MKKIKNWLVNRFLPVVAREILVSDNARLQREVDESHKKIEQLEAYISGLEAGIKAQRRIIINTGEAKK